MGEKLTKGQIFKIILGANYMDIQSLLHLGCAKIATLIKGKSPEEIKKILGDDDELQPLCESCVKDRKRSLTCEICPQLELDAKKALEAQAGQSGQATEQKTEDMEVKAPKLDSNGRRRLSEILGLDLDFGQSASFDRDL